MLNILKLKKKQNIQVLKRESGDGHGKIKDTIPANKEWFNSIYVYNKNSLKLLPVTDNVVSNFIKSYFYMFSKILEKPKYKRKDIRARRYCSRRIWVGRPEIKHTNSNLTINLYIYNRQDNLFVSKWYKILKMSNPLLYLFYNISSDVLKKTDKLNEKLLKKLPKKLPKKINNFLEKILKVNKVYLLKSFSRSITPILLTRLIFLQKCLYHKFKFSNFLIHVKQMLQKLYNKNVEFNLVSLKNFQLSSDILSQIITTKIKKKKNRAVKVIKASLRKIKTPVLNERTVKREETKLIERQNIIISDFIKTKKDYLNICISEKGVKWFENRELEDAVLNSTRYKLINGITLKASGRITRRIIAERARCSIRSIGTLKNVNTSYKGLSSVTVRGYKKSNIDKTLLWSKTHVGAFGLKGWISSY